MKKHIFKYQLQCFLLCITLQVFGQSPSEIGAQWIFSSENDSMQIKDLAESHDNYIILFYGAWSDQSKEQVDIFEAHQEAWKDEYELDIFILNDFYTSSVEDGLTELAGYPFINRVSKNIRSDIDILRFPSSFLFVNDQLILHNESLRTKEAWEASFDKYIKFDLRENLSTDIKQLIGFSFFNCMEEIFEIRLDLRDSIDNIYDLTAMLNDHSLKETADFECIRISPPENDFYFKQILFNVEVCQTIRIYSPLIKTIVEMEVTDVYTKDGRRHVVTNLPFKDCPGNPEFLTFISGIGSNGGLVPLFDNTFVYSTLLCASINDEPVYLLNDDVSNCALTSQSNLVFNNFEDVQVFPNPSSHQIEIKGIEAALDRIEIKDMQGKTWIKISGDQKRIDIDILNPGIYLLSMSIENNTLHKKFIKQ